LDLGAKVARLEAQLRAGEETVQRKEAGSQKMKESLEVEIRELQSAVKQKEEALESRDSEINDLKSQTDVMAEQVAQLELAIEQTKGAAAIEAQNAGQVIEGLRANIATLKAQLKQTEQAVKETGSMMKEVDQHRDRPVIELHAGLEPQTSGLNEMSSSFEGAKASAGTQAQGVVARVPSMATEFPNETVPQDAFDGMIAEFSERANVIRSMASLIVRHHVRTLGESMEEFPQTRLPELVESLSREISDAKLKANFRERFGKA
jgi:predicted RNase H-like nuclease (RuvC/YqgF family)